MPVLVVEEGLPCHQSDHGVLLVGGVVTAVDLFESLFLNARSSVSSAVFQEFNLAGVMKSWFLTKTFLNLLLPFLIFPIKFSTLLDEYFGGLGCRRGAVFWKIFLIPS